MMKRSQLREVLDILYEHIGVDFTHYHKQSVISSILKECGNYHMDEYIELLKNNPNKINTLSKSILVGVTRFFRNPDFFNQLKTLLPSKKHLKCWVVGCATGEEAYSLAILLEELHQSYEIIATDVDLDRIVSANKGSYGEGISSDVSSERLSCFFLKTSSGYQVKDHLRRHINFRTHELFEGEHMEDIDVILCRNVLVYFDDYSYDRLYENFYHSLNKDGLLCVGLNEHVDSSLFKLLKPSIYMKSDT